MKELFHTVMAKGLFACKRAQPIISPAIAFLSTIVWKATKEDWQKLVKLMCLLKPAVNDMLTWKQMVPRLLNGKLMQVSLFTQLSEFTQGQWMVQFQTSVASRAWTPNGHPPNAWVLMLQAQISSKMS
jgi:hypothetical protein